MCNNNNNMRTGPVVINSFRQARVKKRIKKCNSTRRYYWSYKSNESMYRGEGVLFVGWIIDR